MRSKVAIFLLVSVATLRAGLPPFESAWDNEALPVLDRYCFKCHAGVRQKSGLDLRSVDTILRGGERGPAVIPGHPEQSRLLQFLEPDADPHMPPEGKKQATPAEIAGLRDWVSKLPQPEGVSFSATNAAWVDGYLRELQKLSIAGEAPSSATAPREAIDSILASDWAEQKITPAPQCDDATFVRRIYLDLAGRIPTEEERQAFLSSTGQNRRDELIERLLESPEYGRHMRDIFDVVLLGRPKGRNEAGRRDHGWHAYLEESFRLNRPWNVMVREMIEARGTDPSIVGASQFLYERRNNYQAMAEAVAPVAFGMQIGCAQCHNHPLSWEVEQRHYWGLVAAFNRSKNVDTPAGIALAESAIGGFVQFTNLKKESQPAALAFLNGKVVEEKRPAENEKEKDDSSLYVIPPSGKEAREGRDAPKVDAPSLPKFSRREALADAATCDNPRLARAFVNRMWQVLIGRGIVHPVDQMDSRHRPGNPVLLEWLAKEFEQSGYDVKRLVRAIVRSRAYQLDSKAPGSSVPPASAFARALDKPLSAEQLAASVLVATGNFPGSEARSEELRRAMVQKFPDFMPATYNPSLDQALFWANSPTIDALLQPKDDNTAAKLLAIDSPVERIKRAFLLVLGRDPDPAELAEMSSLTSQRTAENSVKDVLWAMLSSAEFQLNH